MRGLTRQPTGAAAALVLLALSGCASPLSHVPARDQFLISATGRAVAPIPPALPAKRPLRVAVYGDTRGDRRAHQEVVAALRLEKPDLVVFTGDALQCVPTGHLPDLGAAKYLVPLWPQFIRGHPAFSLASLLPFPALLHETIFSRLMPVRDPDGFNAFLEDTAPVRRADGTPLLFVPGNHDLYHRFDRREVARLFGAPDGSGGRDPQALWFAVDVGGVRFVILNTGSDLLGDDDPIAKGGPQLRWLEDVLADAERKGLHSIVALHLPPYSSGKEDGPVPNVRARIAEDLFLRNRVDLVLCGHAHAYERIERPGANGRPLTFVVTGGGGAPFHSEAEPDLGSRRFVARTRHFVLLELDDDEIRGRMVPVPGGPDGDAFTVSLR